MKRSTYIFILILHLLNNSCAQENDSLCESSCDNESVIEHISGQKARVIEDDEFGFILSTNPSDFTREPFAASNEYILVPCNWDFTYKHNTMVLISGNKKSCCNLIIDPYVWGGFGCKFEITSIEDLNNKK